MSAVPLGELADAPVVNAGFVERLQGTILYEHWRVEFRRRLSTPMRHRTR
jgi:hypothetical protein